MSSNLPEPPRKYLWQPLPVEYDFLVEEFVRSVCELSKDERNQVTVAFNTAQRSAIGAFVTRGASLSVTRNSIHLLSTAAKAFAIRGTSDDFRYDFMTLSVVRDAAGRIGADFTNLITEAANFGSDDVRKTIQSYLPNSASISQMAFELVPEGDGFRYISTFNPLNRKKIIRSHGG